MPRPFTPDWAAAFHTAVNASADYRAAAAGWTWSVALALDPAPALGYPDAVAVALDLDRGTCRGARLVPAAAADTAFVLRGDYPTWKAIVRGALDPMAAVATGKLAVDRGALTTLMLHVGAARALVAVARAVPTEFPDEHAAGETRAG
jgi:putative sterol carrier protein